MFQRYYADASEKASFTLTHRELFYTWIATKLKFFPAEDSLLLIFISQKQLAVASQWCGMGYWTLVVGSCWLQGFCTLPFTTRRKQGGKAEDIKNQRITTYTLLTFSCVFGGRSPFHSTYLYTFKTMPMLSAAPGFAQSFLEGLLPFLLPSSFAVPCLCMLGSFYVKIWPLSTDYQDLGSL